MNKKKEIKQIIESKSNSTKYYWMAAIVLVLIVVFFIRLSIGNTPANDPSLLKSNLHVNTDQPKDSNSGSITNISSPYYSAQLTAETIANWLPGLIAIIILFAVVFTLYNSYRNFGDDSV